MKRWLLIAGIVLVLVATAGAEAPKKMVPYSVEIQGMDPPECRIPISVVPPNSKAPYWTITCQLSNGDITTIITTRHVLVRYTWEKE